MIPGFIARWAVLVMVVIAAAGIKGYNAGYAKHEAEALAEIHAAETRARAAERKGVKDMAALATRHHLEKKHAEAEIDRLTRDLRSGARRLSVALARVPSCADSTPAAGAGREERAELDPETAAALVAITHDGDTAIRERNQLIDAYAIAQEVCGK